VREASVKAAGYYSRSCTLGSPTGCYSLAQLYLDGRGVPANRAKADSLYRVACKLGSDISCSLATPEQP